MIRIPIFAALKFIIVIQLHDLKFEPFISEGKITAAIDAMALKSTKIIKGKRLYFWLF